MNCFQIAYVNLIQLRKHFVYFSLMFELYSVWLWLLCCEMLFYLLGQSRHMAARLRTFVLLSYPLNNVAML